MNLTKDNYNTILKLKTNKPLVYYHTEVPTTLTYESAVYNKSASDATLKLDTPAGADLNITKAKWGMDSRKEDHGKHIWVDKTKHSEIHNKIYYTVKQPIVIQPNGITVEINLGLYNLKVIGEVIMDIST